MTNMHEDMEKLITAKQIEEEDKAKIKWPKTKNYVLPRGRTTKRPRNRYRPKAEFYWEILRQHNICLTRCQQCNSEYHITIHHKDLNCFNNELDNLQVLCWGCHKKIHNSDYSEVIEEEEDTVEDL